MGLGVRTVGASPTDPEQTSVNLASAMSPSPGKAEFMPTIRAVSMSLPARAALCIECLVVRTSRRSDEIIGRLDALGAKAAEGHCAGCAKFGPVISVAHMAKRRGTASVCG